VSSFSWVLPVLEAIIIVVALFVVPRRRSPSAAIAWLLLIVVLPFVGIILFLLLGSHHLPASRRRKEDAVAPVIRAAAQELGESALPGGDSPSWVTEVVSLAHRLGGMPMLSGNSVRLSSRIEDSLESLISDIDRAREVVNVQFYILVCDARTEPVFAALERATARGVRVHVLMDGWASRWIRGGRRTRRRLRKLGAEWSYMLPLRPLWGEFQRPDLRNHRKIVTIDANVAYTGSMNLIDDSYNRSSTRRSGMRWVDLLLRVEGPAARELAAVFSTDWYLETGQALERPTPVSEVPRGSALCQVVPSGPGYASESNLKVFLSLLHHARRHVVIVSPYFVPNEAMLYALSNAVARKVRIELYVSEQGDHLSVQHAQASYYEQLLAMGVELYLFRRPGLLHAKFVSVDDRLVALGSSNMDMRSFQLNMEVTVLGAGPELVGLVGSVAADYRSRSRRLFPAEWARRPLLVRGLDNLMRLTSALQ
jgi:cardiolipin synthase